MERTNNAIVLDTARSAFSRFWEVRRCCLEANSGLRGPSLLSTTTVGL